MTAPSFGGVEDAEDMAAIFARTHLIVLTEQAVYWRVAGTDKGDVAFIPWAKGQSKDIQTSFLMRINMQKPFFHVYKKDQDARALPPNQLPSQIAWTLLQLS